MGLVCEAIDTLSESHSLAAGIDFPKTGRCRCKLASGVEATFVAVLCDHVMHHLAARGIEQPFHEFFYIPSRRAEGKVGYDLSIGCYNSNSRIRTMHKLIYPRWCDEKWTWSLSKFYRSDCLSNDHRHLETLLKNYENYNTYPRLAPYLVLNVCYCIHDYRRMGATHNGWQIPSFDSLLRTVIVDLAAICRRVPNWRNVLQYPDFGLVVTKQAPRQEEDELAQEYLCRIGKKEMYEVRVDPDGTQLEGCVLTLEELCLEVEEIVRLDH